MVATTSKIFSRWVPKTMVFFDTEITLKLRAFTAKDAPGFRKLVQDRWALLELQPGETQTQYAARSAQIMEAYESVTRESFERHVRLAEPLEDPERGVKLETGLDLYNEAPHDFRLAVMHRLAELASLGETEGNSSGSPSTSTAAAGLPSTDSPVPSTDAAGSTEPSTAPASPGTSPFSPLE